MTSITSAATSTCTIVSTTTNSDPPCRPPCWPPCLPPCWPQCRPPCLLPCRPPPPKPRPTPPWPILSPNLSNQNKKMKSGANALKTMGQICKNYGAKWSKLWGKCAKNYGANLQRASNTQSTMSPISPILMVLRQLPMSSTNKILWVIGNITSSPNMTQNAIGSVGLNWAQTSKVEF